MQGNIPLWIKEILDNDIINTTKYHPICSGNYIIEHKKTNYCSSVSQKSFLEKDNLKVAFFRDCPFLPISTGAANSIYWMMNALVDRGVEVFLFYSYRGWSSRILYKNQKFTSIFISPDDFYTNRKIIKELLLNFHIDICHFDSAEAICIQQKLIPRRCKVLFEVHNIESDLARQFKLPQKNIKQISNKEAEAFEKSNAVIVRSELDYKSALRLRCDKKKLFIYRGGININSISYLQRNKLSNNKILFLGHLNYRPNQEAVKIIAEKIAPFTKKKFIIAGKGSPELKKRYCLKNIKFIGLVKNLNNLFYKVDLSLAPIISGSGTRLKVLDFMAAGIPVICTDIAIEGLGSKIKNCLVVENDFEKYNNIINKLYSNSQEVQRLSDQGRKFVCQNRDWSFCIDDILNVYRFILLCLY